MSTQAAQTNDVNCCTRCKTPCTVAIFEGQKSTKFQCPHCQLVQEWRPTKNYKLATA